MGLKYTVCNNQFRVVNLQGLTTHISHEGANSLIMMKILLFHPYLNDLK